METVMTTEEYNQTIQELIQIMNVPTVNEEKRGELEEILDKIDSYNGMEFLKVNK